MNPENEIRNFCKSVQICKQIFEIQKCFPLFLMTQLVLFSVHDLRNCEELPLFTMMQLASFSLQTYVGSQKIKRYSNNSDQDQIAPKRESDLGQYYFLFFLFFFLIKHFVKAQIRSNLVYPITLHSLWGTTDPIHLVLSSAALGELAKSIPVH